MKHRARDLPISVFAVWLREPALDIYEIIQQHCHDVSLVSKVPDFRRVKKHVRELPIGLIVIWIRGSTLSIDEIIRWYRFGLRLLSFSKPQRKTL